ncbi:MAG: pentapeptide repeat-containing protein [Methanoregula sp.]|uniref:pentapeptide repeat-containing protein n=1 Tax=Methanoregula sp. TaxID=2052170 RepID=UPI003C240481
MTELRTILPGALKEILRKHLAWLNDDPEGEKANLRHANLRHADLSYADLGSADLGSADLRHADLSSANLRHANLRHADLSYADLDMSVFPLWCGSLGIKVDIRLSAQIAYHFCRFETDDEEVKAAQQAIKTLANKFHRIGNDVEEIP